MPYPGEGRERMSTFLTVICTEEEKNLPVQLLELLAKLELEVRLVHRQEDVDPASDLVIVLQAEQVGRAFNSYAQEKGITWLPVQFAHTVAHIGPVIIPGVTACFDCLLLRSQANGLAPLAPKNVRFELAWTLVSSILATEVTKWVSRSTNSFVPLSLGHLVEFDAFQLRGDVSPVYKVPTCKTCGVRHEPHLAAQLWREAELVVES